MTTYNEIRKINVNEHTEKKGKFTYLSWAWAVDQLLQLDPTATWAYGQPSVFPDGTMMVFCEVKAFGKTMTSMLPVLNHQNKAIPNPNAMEVNTAMQRCLVKAIALHGLGLYIYAGEDLPEEEPVDMTEVLNEWLEEIEKIESMDQLRDAYKTAYKVLQKDQNALKALVAAKDKKVAELS
jgi:hypothetical protein